MTVSDVCPHRLLPPARHPIDWWAFGLGMVATPLLIGVLGLPLVVPTIAVILGLPAQLLLGGPAAWWAITRGGWSGAKPGYGTLVLWSLIANCGVIPVGLLLTLAPGNSEVGEILFPYFACGLIVAPIEALLFTAIYRATMRPVAELPADPDVFS